ncbi:hypothetical protein [Lignipirellula cremea]|uniref:hypothetical protein n=1 Tax=Lignipirellula cremea TaxID=2528010 RepID=UPI00119E6627|nr:hypothetical protein [Lignipirellula cremea]
MNFLLSGRRDVTFTSRLAWTLVLTIMIGTSAPALADRYDDQYLDGLRERRLFSLAESFCLQRLQAAGNAIDAECDLTLALLRTYAAHAINSPRELREPIWQKAHAAAQDFAARHPADAERFLVLVQDALTTLARGELLRQELETRSAAGTDKEPALEQILLAVNALESIDKELTREIPRRAGSREGLSDSELFALQNNLRYQLARAHRNLALCYEEGTANQVNSLQQASGMLTDVLTRIGEADPLYGNVQLDQVVCLRLLGDLDGAQRLLTTLQSSSPGVELLLRARAEAARLQLDRQKPELAYAEISRGRNVGGRLSAELDFAHLETYLALWKKAQEENSDQTPGWLAKAKAMVEQIERAHGPYWRRRADRLLVNTAGAGGGGDLDILVRQADRLYLEGAFAEAITAYDQAGRQALAAGSDEQAFLLLYRAGLIEQKQKHYADAALRLRAAALATPEQPQAPDAHLLAAHSAAQVVAADPASLPAYLDLLEEHLTRWPEKPTADKARMWLGRIREHQHSWSEAMRIYLEVSPQASDYASALEAASRCAKTYLAELKAAGQPYDQQAENTALQFESLLLDEQQRLPTTWTPALREAAIAAARIRLQHSAGGQARASSILEGALAAGGDADPAWRTSATALLVAALAAQPSRLAEAEKMLRELADASPQELLEMVSGLSAAAEAAGPQGKERIAGLQLKAAALLAPQRAKLSAASQSMLDLVQAQALAAGGNRDQAAQAYTRLIAANPRDGGLQEEYAAFLLAGADRASWEQALLQWRRVGQGSRPRTDRWWRAKYNTALAMYRLGDKAGAAELIQYLKATPPGLDGSSEQTALEQLLKLCQ